MTFQMRWSQTSQERLAELELGFSLSPGRAWDGVSLTELTSPASGEFAEGHFHHHALVLRTSRRPNTEMRAASSVWASVPAQAMVLEFIPAGMPFAIRWRHRNSAIVVNIEPSFVDKVLGPQRQAMANPRHWVSPDDGLLTQTMLAMAQDVRAGSPMGAMFGESLGSVLVAHLAQKATRVPRAPSKHGLAPEKLKRIVDRIQSDLCSDHSLPRLAGLAEMSVDGFVRAFKQSTGLPPHQYVLRKRVERAQTMLRNPRLSLADIALQVGFADQSHFSRMFRRISGQAPLGYRRGLL